MIVVAGKIIPTQNPYAYGELNRDQCIPLLRSIWLAKLTSRLEGFITTNPRATEQVILDKAQKLESSNLFEDMHTNANADCSERAIAEEAIAIATERIISHLAEFELPSPPRLRESAEALAKNNSKILLLARERVEAKLIASSILTKESSHV